LDFIGDNGNQYGQEQNGKVASSKSLEVEVSEEDLEDGRKEAPKKKGFFNNMKGKLNQASNYVK
jgi:hypothetical protein